MLSTEGVEHKHMNNAGSKPLCQSNNFSHSLLQIFDKISDNARYVLQIDNARLAADDFKVK